MPGKKIAYDALWQPHQLPSDTRGAGRCQSTGEGKQEEFKHIPSS